MVSLGSGTDRSVLVSPLIEAHGEGVPGERPALVESWLRAGFGDRTSDEDSLEVLDLSVIVAILPPANRWCTSRIGSAMDQCV